MPSKKRKSKKSKNASRYKSIPRFVSVEMAARMPVGSNHLKAPGILNSKKNHQGITFRNSRKKIFPGLNQKPRIYRYPLLYIPRIEAHPFGYAEPSKSIHNALSVVPEASLPRGYRKSLLREAQAVPIQTVLAEPEQPDWGLMYHATQSLMPTIMRPMTEDEIRKETEFRRRESIRRTGGPASSGLAVSDM